MDNEGTTRLVIKVSVGSRLFRFPRLPERSGVEIPNFDAILISGRFFLSRNTSVGES